jgi:acyl-CoA thioester hydrolase
VLELDETSVRYACGLFDGPRCIGLAEAVGAHRIPDEDGDPGDLAARLEPFRMRAV